MYHAESNTPALARTSNLNEELGQVISFAPHPVLNLKKTSIWSLNWEYGTI